MELTELNLNEEQTNGVQEYVKEVLRNEGDKIKTNYSKINDDYDNQIKELNTTIEDLKGKLPVEKSETELALEKRLKVVEDREKEAAKTERYNNLTSGLTDKGLSNELAKYLNIEGVEDLEAYIGEVANVIGKQLKSFKPSNTSHIPTNVTKEQFNKMGYMERIKIYNENKELYSLLSK